jgi:hypothetical protein
MGPHTATPITTVAELTGQSDRRLGNRTPTLFSLLYSGMDSDQMLIGDGIVTDLSPNGIGICGNRSVTPGIEMALFIDLPGLEEPLCIAQSRVSWVTGHRFGVELGSMKLEEKKHLQFFLRDHITYSEGNSAISNCNRNKEVPL